MLSSFEYFLGSVCAPKTCVSCLILQMLRIFCLWQFSAYSQAWTHQPHPSAFCSVWHLACLGTTPCLSVTVTHKHPHSLCRVVMKGVPELIHSIFMCV
jgi:hypothetical protein